MDIKNYKECFENLVNNTIEYLVQNNIETMVLGISGGIDSTVTVAICNEVSKRTSIPIVGYSLMCTTNENEECMAADAVGNCFCSEFHTINIQDIYLKQSIAFKEFNDNAETYPIVEGNIKARTRMQFLYYIAGLRGGIVIDTDNLTEHSLGFWTLHGDDGDLDIIGNLWKHEVYGMAKYLRDNFYNNDNDKLHALNLSIELNPTDGNGVAAGGDLAQIAPGYTYDDVDIMINKLTTRTKEDIEYLKSKYPVHVIRNISNRMIRSEFKRKHRPIIVSHIK
jgi:NAD+ synthetase